MASQSFDPAGNSVDGRQHVRLWDLPIRLIHWSFVLLLIGLWWSAEQAQDIDLHKKFGYALLGLLVFRLLWGFVGSSTARFRQFVRGPAGVFSYLRNRDAEPIVGHNPLGGWSVIALLLLLSLQVVIGLFAQDVDGIESGSLSYLVDYDTADQARELHHLLFNGILALVALHIAALLFYRFVHRNDLVAPMITGRKRFDTAVAEPTFAPWWRALLCLAIASAVAIWVSAGCPLPWADS